MADINLSIKGRDQLVKRLLELRRNMRPDSPSLHASFIRIGALIANQAKINIKRKNLIDTGRLLNSIDFEFFKDATGSGLRIGSFGVPYAALWEFGYRGTQQIKGHQRTVNKLFGKQLDQPLTLNIRPHARKVNVTARPYLGPAYELHRERVITILQEALNK